MTHDPYVSTPDELASAEYHSSTRATGPLVTLIAAWLARAEARRAHYERNHPRPLTIDGHAYRRRTRRR